MDQSRPVLVTDEYEQKLPILIIDKKGLMGGELAEMLKEGFLTVLVSGRELDVHRRIVHIPYRKRIPIIPDNEYSHIFLVFNGEEEMLDMLPSFVKKARETKCKLFFITSIVYSTEQLHKHLANHLFNDIKVIVYGETFDDRTKEGNFSNLFIHHVRTYNRLEIPNSGMDKVYPVLFKDVVEAIVQSAFVSENPKRLILVFPRHQVTTLSVARILQKINPLLRIDFSKKKISVPNYFIPPGGDYWFHDYDLEEKLRTIGYGYHPQLPHYRSPRRLRVPSGPARISWRLVLICFFILLFILPPLTTFAFSALGAASLGQSFKDAEEIKVEAARKKAEYALFSFDQALAASKTLYFYELLGLKVTEGAQGKIRLGKRAAEMEIDVLSSVASIQRVMAGKSNDPKGDFLKATANIKNSLLTLEKLRAEGELPSEVSQKLKEIDPTLSLFENTIDSLPVLLGTDRKRNYLVLFQNNMELRPGGGFIGSYGIVEVDKGRIGKLKVYDVYDADGRLSTHVEPPYGLRRYMDASHWFLRDSNFDVDFSQDAGYATSFLQLETGQNVDGVIAIDTTFLKNILYAFGSVYVEDYKETVTPDNFYLLTQTKAEKNFFPGSTQKKDFLTALFNSILVNLTDTGSANNLLLLKKIGEAALGKHLLFAFSDPATQNLFTVNNLSSSLWDGREMGENDILDYVGVVDANLGANKTNYYLKKAMRQSVKIAPSGDYESTLTVDYENSSSKESPFGGDYKNYVRFILPEKAKLEAVAIDGQVIPTTPAVVDPDIFTRKNFIPPSELEIEQTHEKGKSLIGLLVVVPTQSKKRIAITYSMAGAIDVKKPAFSYDLLVFKQAGSGDDPYSFLLSYPATFLPVETGKGIIPLDGKLSFESLLSTDKAVTAIFSKK